MGPVSRYLNSFTMYRLVTYVLAAYGVVGITLAYTGQDIVTFSGNQAAMAAAVSVAASCLSNLLFARLYKAVPNHESAIITGLILFLVMPPGSSAARLLSLSLVSVIAMASKYVLAWQGRHIFNPAAVAMTLAGFAGLVHPSWWVGNKYMALFLAAGGLLIAGKLRRLRFVCGFIAASLAVTALLSVNDDGSAAEALKLGLLSSPLLFFGTVMLTEPFTSPYKHRQLWLFAALVITLNSVSWKLGFLNSSTELSLVIANAVFAAGWYRPASRLTLKKMDRLAGNTYNFTFVPDRVMRFRPGQYAEWTLPGVPFDSRGNRRTFSIASSPSRPEITLGVRIFDGSSKFKMKLRQMKAGQHIQLSHVAGEFVLPDDTEVPLAFIAGGIGITPFLSMLEAMSDSGRPRDLVLFYCANTPDELVYLDYLKKLAGPRAAIVPVISSAVTRPSGWSGLVGPLGEEALQSVDDYALRRYYLSGPPAMVEAYRRTLRSIGIARDQIVTDYFFGY